MPRDGKRTNPEVPMRWLSVVFTLCFVCFGPAQADDAAWIELSANGLESWKDPHGDWFVADRVALDPQNPKRLSATPGKGILVNGKTGRTRNLLTKQSFGDMEVKLEFMIPKGANSGVKFEGLYEIQIFDSFGVKKPKGSDCGGIYPRAEQLPTYHHIDEGTPPRTNAARPAGEWQTMEVIFHAPRFDAAGKKTVHAKFVKVILNGQTIHENVEVRTPTGHAWRDKEIPTGPLLLQADHGPVAFRNVRIRPLAGAK
jgi:hypothetical protein